MSMFSSFFSSNTDPHAPTFHPVTSHFPHSELFGELEPTDTEWACSGGFVTETQVWYQILEDDKFLMCQVIHSSIGLWSATVQFTFKLYDPKTKEQTWKSVNVSNFVVPPPPQGGVQHDKRSCKADEFTIIHKAANPASNVEESYTINAHLGKDVQVSLVVVRPQSVPGFKLGKGPSGGFSNYGVDPSPAKREGYVIHRFWPRTSVSGLVVCNGKAIEARGMGVFIHAIQGMRPNLIATRWNFANFQSREHGGVSAIQMEFTTPEQFGRKGNGSGGVKVNIGSLVIGNKLVAVTGETSWPEEPLKDDALVKSRAAHLDPHNDPETHYTVPSRIIFEWSGSDISSGLGPVAAKLDVDVGTHEVPKGLIEKVDVLAEIPKVVKAVVNYVSGAKPYIYQWLSSIPLEITAPASVLSEEPSNEPKTISVQGTGQCLRVSASEKRNIRTLLTSSHSNTTQDRLLQRLPQPNFPNSDDSISTKRFFHATRPNNGWPLVLLAALKSTGFVGAMQVTIRVVLTLLPVVLFRKHVGRKFLRKLDKHPGKFPEWEKYRHRIVKGIKINTAAAKILFLTPLALVGLVIFASLERTPITGRLRVMVISPDEEESIVRELSGGGWFEAVRNVLATHRAPPTFVLPSDWRYQWVEKVFRRLESVVPSLQDEELMRQVWLSHAADEVPFPPPPSHPLLPRPSAYRRLHYLEPPGSGSEHRQHHAAVDVPPRSVLGPPYSLLVTSDPDQSNAFSYGFGPNGSGGIVIFSGLIDDILRNGTPNPTSPVQQPTSFMSYLRSLFIPAPPPPPPVPSPEQEAQLAALVAHELAHLLLSHHLETLSSTTVFWPNIVSIMTDLFRALLFPITMIGGPFLNDALEQVGEAGKREFSIAADSCFSHRLELEADAVSMRLLALAGWDPRAAVDFWEAKLNSAAKDPNQTPVPGVLPGALWVSEERNERSSHPIGEVRIKELRKELSKWQLEKERVLLKQNK